METVSATTTSVNPLNNISVILVDTIQAGNIGSAARALKNMGLSQLKLVNAPPLNEECRRMAGRAFDLVEGAAHFSRLDDAVAGVAVLAATTSSRDRRVGRVPATPRQAAPVLLGHAQTERVAIVFGSERSGLNEDQLARCQILITIPANPEYPVLNLAQSVLLVAYELGSPLQQPVEPASPSASQTARQEMFAQIRQTLIEIGFLSSSNPEPVLHSIQSILDQPGLTARDVRIIRGVMSQMQWYVQDGWKLGPEGVRKP